MCFPSPVFRPRDKEDDAATEGCRVTVTPPVLVDQSMGAGWAQHLEVGAGPERVEVLGAGRAARDSLQHGAGPRPQMQGNTQQAESDQQADSCSCRLFLRMRLKPN